MCTRSFFTIHVCAEQSAELDLLATVLNSDTDKDDDEEDQVLDANAADDVYDSSIGRPKVRRRIGDMSTLSGAGGASYMEFTANSTDRVMDKERADKTKNALFKMKYNKKIHMRLEQFATALAVYAFNNSSSSGVHTTDVQHTQDKAQYTRVAEHLQQCSSAAAAPAAVVAAVMPVVAVVAPAVLANDHKCKNLCAAYYFCVYAVSAACLAASASILCRVYY
eukprot:14626-Heterococcus_DN1.PRE.2